MSAYIYIVTIGLQNPIYLTDAHRDFAHGGHTFIAGKLKLDQAVTQRAEPSANDFALTIVLLTHLYFKLLLVQITKVGHV